MRNSEHGKIVRLSIMGFEKIQRLSTVILIALRNLSNCGAAMYCSWSIFYGGIVITAMLLDYIFLLAYSEIYSYVSLLRQIIKITRTLTLLFILLHLNADATMRLEGFTLLLWPELLPVS